MSGFAVAGEQGQIVQITTLQSTSRRVALVPGSKPKSLFVLDPGAYQVIYGPEELAALEGMLDFLAQSISKEELMAEPGLLTEVEVLVSGWGAPRLDEVFLEAAPNLKVVFYGAGSIRSFVTPAFWKSGVKITSAYAANAVPVAEYALATILLSLKHFWSFTRQVRKGDGWGDHTRVVPGGFRSTVGFVSFGMIARRVACLLRNFDVHPLVYCPFLTDEEAGKLGVERCSLPQVFRRSDVVSLHTPELPETRGLIKGSHFEMMKPGATFINSARGGVVAEKELIEVLRKRPDLTAILDVCDPEPPAPDSLLLQLPNAIVSPHIAGSLGPECRRLGQYMVEEVWNYVNGLPLAWEIDEALAAKLA